MKRAVGWALSWAFFWVGHLMSYPLGWANDLACRFDPDSWWVGKTFDGLYWLYNTPMCLSSRLQDWGGAGAWEEVKPADQE
jgi:hypothetical protein